ncbi:alpha-ketoacid dehydrogenase subunit beta, partial [Marinitenerispora sediminis]
ATPADAYSLLREAIACPDPVVFLEPKRRYWSKAEVATPVRTEPMDRAVVRRSGTDVTLISYGPTVQTALDTAEAAREEGWDVEVVDLRSLAPFDDATVTTSVLRTGRAVVTHEAATFAGYGAEVAARVTEHCFHYLEAPVLRVGGFDIPYPPPKLEHHHLPGVDRLLDAIGRLQWESDWVSPVGSRPREEAGAGRRHRTGVGS